MPAGVWKVLRCMCYAALCLAIVAVAALVIPFAFELCRDGGAGQIVCTAPIYRTIFDLGFTIIMFGAFTGLPAGLAAAGLVLLLRDSVAWIRS